MNELHLFAGAGGGILGGLLLGHTPVCACEIEPYPRKVLLQRQRDGILPKFPIWNDIRTFDGKPWRGLVDILCGGFPCQDVSPARTNTGERGTGLEGAKSGLWFEMLRVVSEVQPEYVFAENSAHLRTKGLGLVLQGLADQGYDVAWCVLSAADLGANHERKRMWILGRKLSTNSDNHGESVSRLNDEAQGVSEPERLPQETANSNRPQREGRGIPCGGDQEHTHPRVGSWWQDTSHLDGMDDGVAHRMDRLRAIGNGQVPLVAATAFEFLKRSLEQSTTPPPLH